MPLNVGRFNTSVFLVLSALTGAASAQTQVPQASPSPAAPVPISQAPSAAEVMRMRISKAKAFIAVRNYYAAINELENIRRETADQSVHAVANVLLMNSYLEQGDHKKAQALLNDFYTQQKTTKPNAAANYSSVAAQIIKSARGQAERYRSLGLNITDRNLPLEALNDLEKMRETVELVITQTKEMSAEKAKAADALGLLEEATNSRVMIARDEYDARRWRDAVADSREEMASSRSVIINAIDGTTESTAKPSQTQTAAALPNSTAAAIIPASIPADTKPVETKPAVIAHPENKPGTVGAATPKAADTGKDDEPKKADEEKTVAKPDRDRVIAKADEPKTDDLNKVKAIVSSKPTGPIEVGSLLPYVAKQSPATYPAAARSIRANGIVRVEVTIDEEGNVEDVQKATGPALLQASAKEAIRKWKFRPFVVEGQPVKATGFVNFNFSL